MDSPYVKVKECRREVADVIFNDMINRYGKDNVKRDGDRFVRVKFPTAFAPMYVRIDLKMEP